MDSAIYSVWILGQLFCYRVHRFLKIHVVEKKGFIIMKISEQLIVRTIEEKTMIINLKNGTVTVIDEIGTMFWNSIINKIPREDFILKMLNEFDISKSCLEKDYEDFIERMKEDEIIC